jgi:hypothetical protein
MRKVNAFTLVYFSVVPAARGPDFLLLWRDLWHHHHQENPADIPWMIMLCHQFLTTMSVFLDTPVSLWQLLFREEYPPTIVPISSYCGNAIAGYRRGSCFGISSWCGHLPPPQHTEDWGGKWCCYPNIRMIQTKNVHGKMTNFVICGVTAMSFVGWFWHLQGQLC